MINKIFPDKFKGVNLSKYYQKKIKNCSQSVVLNLENPEHRSFT